MVITSVVSMTRCCVACLLISLSKDGISFPNTDSENIEVLIQDYFNESANDESRSDDDEECSKEFSNFQSFYM